MASAVRRAPSAETTTISLRVDSDKLILAVGDVSGKGISAALLMATIHSAVRAYSLEGMPSLREPVRWAAAGGSGLALASTLERRRVVFRRLLSLLNHQLYQSTPAEKYATLFLGVYDGRERKLTYSNGGHLPPIILGEDGSVRRLEQGGTVVGLFDHRSYEEAIGRAAPGGTLPGLQRRRDRAGK